MDDTLEQHARDLATTNRYLTLGTVDADGLPWTSPVYFSATDDLRRFLWVSSPASQHSLNLTARPAVSLAVFDSTVAPYHGRCLYAAGSATVLEGADLEAGLASYPGPAERGGSAIAVDDVTGDAPWRLYRADATALWVLCPREPRQPCPRHGRADDHRVRIW
ncbi:pyridoxamine 5'-phosphate oxidase family protein [Nocardioides sp. QY071]|uniref:pyridoxamine 5'-phosphate oxidase family protein n=1 Tax=Nocardioides sp. QY071 TaxID=3044187 RepID=UPI00249B43A8|nr:pyridoxamine 5'-phosphate oxidase family protein [Nocardioides sp. QY071]WGY03001.1 pyridoxamine 5'-phosphate oxidase family protein [Nocardioides sp. QY071]